MSKCQSIIDLAVQISLAFEIVILIVTIFFPYVPDLGLFRLNSTAYMLLSPLSPILVIGILYTWLIRVITREARRYSARFNSSAKLFRERFSNVILSLNTNTLPSNFEHLTHPKIMLTTGLVVSALLAFTPYRPDLNPSGALVGVDSSLYVGWISQMLGLPFSQAFKYAFVGGFDGSRPLLLISLYAVSLAGMSPSQIVEYLPLCLAPLLTLSTYVFVRYGGGNQGLAGLTSLFTPMSYYTVVGFWGGYYANWLGMTFVFLFMTSLLVSSKKPTPAGHFSTFALSIAIFLTHPWTWILTLSVGLLFAITDFKETKNPIQLSWITGMIGSGIILDLSKSSLFSTPTVIADIATKFPSTWSIVGVWNNIVEAVLFTNGGLIANSVILGIALISAFVLRFSNRFERLLILWLAVSSLPFLILDSYSQSRIIYDSPIPIMSPILIFSFLTQSETQSMARNYRIVLLLLVTTAAYTLQGLLLI